MKTLFLFLMTVITWNAYAELNSKSVYITAVSDRPPVSVSVIRQADFVAMPITITSEQKDSMWRLTEIRAAKQLIRDRAKANKRLIVKEGSLTVAWKENSKYSSSGSSAYETKSAAQLTLMLPLDPNAPDAIAVAAGLDRFLNDIKFADKTRCERDPIMLVVADPEQYRPQLLEMIGAQVKKTAEQMGIKGHVSIQGLQNPVIACEVDETHVELFLNYSMVLDWNQP